MSIHKNFKIGEKPVGADHSCWIVAEVSQTHEGSLGNAHRYIDMAAEAGADAIKFQTHIAQAESSLEEPFRVKFSQQDDTRYDYWKRMEFSRAGWASLADHCRDRNIVFLSSPFSEEAIDLLYDLKMPAWKVASGEVTNPIMLKKMLQTELPILLSSGMSSLAELDAVVAQIQAAEVPLLVFQCTTKYPPPVEEIGLNMLTEYRQRYGGIPVGLSDHSGTIFPGLGAVLLGVNMIEVHVTLSDNIFGPDVPVSLNPAKLNQLVTGVHYLEQVRNSPVNKDMLADELHQMRRIFGRSLTVTSDLPAGHTLMWSDLSSKKPGYYILVENIDMAVGKTITRAYSCGEFLKAEDLK